MTEKVARHDDEVGGACFSLEELVRYVEDRLSAEQRAGVEGHLKDCTLCTDAVEGLKGYEGEQTFRDMVREVRESIQPRSRGYEQIGGMRTWYAIAAVLVLAAVSTVSYFYIVKPAPNEKLFAEYFEPYPSTRPEIRQPATASGSALENALSAYDRDKSLATLRLFETVLDETTDNLTAHFFVGNLYLLMKQPLPAIQSLQRVTDAGTNEFTGPAAWYLALAYLLNNDRTNCRDLLNELSSKSGFYQQRAIDLLKRIDSLH
jgi:hypothetical protein